MTFMHFMLDYSKLAVEQQGDVQEHGTIKKSEFGKLFIIDLYNYSHCETVMLYVVHLIFFNTLRFRCKNRLRPTRSSSRS